MAKGILPASQLCDYGHIEALWSENQQVLLVDVETHSEITACIKELEEAEASNRHKKLQKERCTNHLVRVLTRFVQVTRGEL